MRRTLSLVLAASGALLAACTPPAPPPDAGRPMSDPATAPLMVAPPVDRSPLPCAAGTVEPTPLPFATVPRDAQHLRLEVVPAPEGAPCVDPHHLLDSPSVDAPLMGSRHATAEGARFVTHYARSAAPLGLGPWALVAGPSGLWLYDLATMARRARLYEGAVLDVATSEDGRRFAFLTEGTAATGGARAAASSSLVFVRFPELGVLRSFDGVPAGRLRMAPDGRRAVIAAGDAGLALYDADSGQSHRATPADGAVTDARVHPDSPDRVLYVGHGNRVGLRDMVAGEEVAQRSTGGAPLFARRDLRALAYEAATDRTVAGGADDLARVFQGLFDASPRQVARVAMGGDVVDLSCCREGRFLVAADTGEVKWADERGEVLWELPALLPSALGEEVRVAPASGMDVLFTVAGRVAFWQPRRPLLVPSDYGITVDRQDVGPLDTLVLARPASRVIVHRTAGAPALLATTEVLGRLDWHAVDHVLRTPDGHRALLGTTSRGTAIAFVAPGGPLVALPPDGPPLGRVTTLTPRRDGRSWVAVDAEGRRLRILPGEGRVEADADR